MSKSKYYIWSAISQYGTQTISFIGNILVARVLMPDDYGLIAMLAIIMGLAWDFTESGFADSLIRKADADKSDFGTVATFNIAIGALMYIIIFFSAPLISSFFRQPELTGIARVLGISILIKALTIMPVTELRKYLHFRSIAIMNIFSNFVSFALTYILALKGFGYWSLALNPVFIPLMNLLFLIFAEKWRPYFCFSISRFKELFGFSANLLVSYITNQIGNNLYSFIIGRFYAVASLGYYRQAQKMYETPTMGLNSVVLTTSYSIIANEKENEKKISMYHDIFGKFITIQSLMVLTLIGLADPIWNLLLGEKWLQSIPYFKLFLLIALAFPLVTINSNIAKIHNRPQLYRNLAFLRNGLKVVALIICARISLIAIIIGQIISTYISVMVDMFFCGRIIDFGLIKQIKQFLRIFYKPLISFLIASSLVYILKCGIYLSGVIWLISFFLILIIVYILTKDLIFKNFKIKLFHIGNKIYNHKSQK